MFGTLNIPAQVATAQCRLAGELFDLNRIHEALGTYQAALRMFERLADQNGQAQVHWGLGLVHQARYDMPVTVHHLETALALWPIERQDRELARLIHDATRAKTFSADWEAAISLAERGLALTERLGDPELLARALLGLVLAHDQDKARPLIPLLDRAEALARAAGDWRTLGRIYGNRANLRNALGHGEGALEDRRRAVEAVDRAGERHRMVFARMSLADHCHQVGAWSEGRAAARGAIELDPESMLSEANAQADLAWMEGRHSDALLEMRAHLAEARGRDDVQGVTVRLYVLADSLLQLGRAPEAEALAREGAELACTRWRGEAGCAMEVLAETLVRVGAMDAEEVISDAQQLIDEFEIEGARPQVLRARGLLLLRRGDVDEAIAVLQSSADIAKSQHALIDYGRTLAVLAEAAKRRGDQPLLSQVEAERAAVVMVIGPEVRKLEWARGLPSPSRQKRERKRSIDGDETPLSPREREVAELVARGLSNRQIAERLVITPGTAGVHVGHVMNKLGVHTRAEIGSWTARRSPALGRPDTAT